MRGPAQLFLIQFAERQAVFADCRQPAYAADLFPWIHASRSQQLNSRDGSISRNWLHRRRWGSCRQNHSNRCTENQFL